MRMMAFSRKSARCVFGSSRGFEWSSSTRFQNEKLSPVSTTLIGSARLQSAERQDWAWIDIK